MNSNNNGGQCGIFNNSCTGNVILSIDCASGKVWKLVSPRWNEEQVPQFSVASYPITQLTEDFQGHWLTVCGYPIAGLLTLSFHLLWLQRYLAHMSNIKPCILPLKYTTRIMESLTSTELLKIPHKRRNVMAWPKFPQIQIWLLTFYGSPDTWWWGMLSIPLLR